MPAPVPEQQGFSQQQMYVWVKGLETKVNNLLREVDTLKNDFMKKSNSLKKDVKNINEEVLAVKRE